MRKQLQRIRELYNMGCLTLGEYVIQSLWVIVENILEISYKFMNGRFGRKKLMTPYRRYWQVIMWTLFIFCVIKFILFPFFEWWGRVVCGMNYIIWGV